MITFKTKGDFKKITGLIERVRDFINISDLDKYGKAGVEVLSSATPKSSGRTSSSWNYKTIHEKNRVKIVWYNDNVNEDVNIALILQYGHSTKNGSWVEGVDYINPAMRPLFKDIANNAWKEVTRK